MTQVYRTFQYGNRYLIRWRASTKSDIDANGRLSANKTKLARVNSIFHRKDFLICSLETLPVFTACQFKLNCHNLVEIFLHLGNRRNEIRACFQAQEPSSAQGRSVSTQKHRENSIFPEI